MIVEKIRATIAYARRLSSTDASIVMRENYETIFGIYNHDDLSVDRPLALVAYQPAEDFSTGTLLDERIENFAIYQVSKHYGLSLMEFLDLPREICIKILQFCKKLTSEEAAILDGLRKGMGEK